MPPPNETLHYYDDNAADYAARTFGELQERQLQAFADGLDPGAKILDLGAGSGRDSLALIERGFDVTPLDGSAGLAREAERRTGQKVRVLRFEQLDYTEAFDGIWASASLHHVPSQGLPDVMKRVGRALLPSGRLFASFKEADADWHDSLGRFFAAMSSDRLHELAAGAGLVVARIERSEAPSFDGTPTMWLAMTARRKP
ncbi:MAG: class I SAM-dependent DNA methyltransferase [Geminicoccaceae bacterium]